MGNRVIITEAVYKLLIKKGTGMTDFLRVLLMVKWADRHHLEMTEKYSYRGKKT